ncbi:MAG: AAA family ATPase [Methylobacterium mesophilicum]|nr:AAA family ATPase [Methylobacterium mesophilicum]
MLLIDRIVSLNGLGAIVSGIRQHGSSEGQRIRVKVASRLLDGDPRPGETWAFEGTVVSTSWGQQVEATRARREPPTGKLVQAYLASAVPGIGPVRAGKLWSAFGQDLPEMLSDECNVPQLAAALHGDSPTLAARLAALAVSGWKEALTETSVIGWLDTMGFERLATARRIARILGNSARETIVGNPWLLVPFAPWKHVDDLGIRVLREGGIEQPRADPRRLVGAVDAAVKGFIAEGHTAATRPMIDEALRRKVGGHASEALTAGLEAGAIIHEGDFFRFPGCMLMEEACLEAFGKLRASGGSLPRSVLKDFRDGTLVPLGNLHPEQQAAVLRVLRHPVSCLQGGAGTGKSHVTRTICAAWEATGGNVLLAALSGKAALRLSRASGRLALTLARLLGQLEKQRKAREEAGRLNLGEQHPEGAVRLDANSLVVVDEAAMVDLPTIYRLLDHMNGHGRLLLVGDDAQLPPIGFGLVYHRLVDAEETTARLTVVHRQSGESGIPAVAAALRAREVPSMSAYRGRADGVSMVSAKPDGIAEAVAGIADDLGGFHDGELMVVTATNGGPAGVDALNGLLQRRRMSRDRLSAVRGAFGQSFAVGDPCIHLRNDYGIALFNGSTGRIVSASEDDRAVVAEFDGQKVCFSSGGRSAAQDMPSGDIVDLALAYAITCHKAQGSQCARVIVPVYRTSLLTPAWLYTAVTRAEKQVVLVGEMEAIAEALSRPWVGESRVVGFRP